jgi:Domain of unknown function (DUF4926)
MLIEEHDSVVLSRPLSEHGLQIGEVGAVVFVHRTSEAYEVDFVTAGAGKGIDRIREGSAIECAKEEDRPLGS